MAAIVSIIVVLLLFLANSYFAEEGKCILRDIFFNKKGFQSHKVYPSRIHDGVSRRCKPTKSTYPYFNMPEHKTTKIPDLPKPAPTSTTTSTTTTTFTTFLPQEPEYKYYQYINRICGYRDEQCLRVHNGKEVLQGRWPWVAAIFEEDSKDFSQVYCTGALISRYYVISDGEMFDSQKGKTFVVRLGDVWFKSPYEEVPHQNFKTKSIKTNSRISELAHAGRAALLELNRPAYFDRAVRPICLPVEKLLLGGVRGQAYIAGYGEPASGKPRSPFLIEATAALVTCAHHVSDHAIHICSNPITYGKGDEGAPVAVQKGHKRQFYMFGWVDNDHLSPRNGMSYYDEMAVYLDWFLENSDLAQPYKPDWT